MKNITQSEKAEIFLKLHHESNLLVLPNIWDPFGARVLESRGYPAAATASAAISASLGYDDHETIKLSTHLEIIRRIVRSVDIPVTADIESGYGSDLQELKESITRIIETGIAGINIEDSFPENGTLRSWIDQCERIALVREIAETMGIHLVINARIDYFHVHPDFPKEEIVDETIKRAKAYIDAGADCVYPIGITDRDMLVRLRKGIASPINVLATDKSESLKTLRKIGINRVSFGPLIFRSCMKKFVNIIDELYDLGSYECFSKDTLPRESALKYLSKEKE